MKSITEKEYSLKGPFCVSQSHNPVGIIEANYHRPRHSDCFVYVLSGLCNYTFRDGKVISVKSGDILYLSKNSRYLMDIPEDYHVIFFDFQFDDAEENFLSKSFRLANHKKMLTYFQNINIIWHSKFPGYRSECLSILYKIYATILKHEAKTYIPTSNMKKIHPSVNVMLCNFTNPSLTLAEISSASGISEGHFRRLFKSIYGTSPTEYIKALRINYAKELLKTEDYSISQVATASGFADIYYFSKIFKTETSFTPTEYRNALWNK